MQGETRHAGSGRVRLVPVARAHRKKRHSETPLSRAAVTGSSRLCQKGQSTVHPRLRARQRLNSTLTGTAQHLLFENRIFRLGNEELSWWNLFENMQVGLYCAAAQLFFFFSPSGRWPSTLFQTCFPQGQGWHMFDFEARRKCKNVRCVAVPRYLKFDRQTAKC